MGNFLQWVTPTDYLERYPQNQVTQPVFSSWGLGGYSEFWLNESNDWVYPLLSQACGEMTTLVKRFPDAGGKTKRALTQAARELLLAQASDWAFMMQAGHYQDYAQKRVKTHLLRFYQLCEQVRNGKLDERTLSDLEEKDNPFPKLDYRVFRNRKL
jgi:1,4-alpha-glucan branching enzyme